MSDRLTAKQEAFVQAYLRTGNGYQSYLECYNVKPDTPRSSVDQMASRLLAKVKVKSRLAEIQSQVTEVKVNKIAEEQASKASKTEVTVDMITSMLLEDRELARKNDQAAAAATATMGLARVHGFIVNKSEDVTPRRHSDEVDARIRQLVGQRDKARATKPPGGARAGDPKGETVPTVPGHGTA